MLEGSILQQLEAAHQGGLTGKRRLNFGVYFKNTLVALCHALEDYILATENPPLVMAAFQRGKWYLQEADRYAEIAKRARQVVIMAAADAGFEEHPTSQHQRVALVELPPEHAVAQEWHLMILSSGYAAMVLCQELSDADYGGHPPQEDRQRKFYGLWTFERALVEEAVNLTIAETGKINPTLQTQLQAHLAAIAAETPHTDPMDFVAVVDQVVDYLETSHNDLLPNGTSFSNENPLDHNILSNEVQAFLRLAQIIDLQEGQQPSAAVEVAALAEMLAQMLDLPAWQMQRLRLASFLHRLTPLQVSESVLTATGLVDNPLPDSEPPISCPLHPGSQILRKLPQLRAVAQIITHQTEWWNGAGGPAGLAGEEIPLESRILGLMAEFQQHAPKLEIPKTINDGRVDEWQDALDGALHQCQRWMGKRWDPQLINLLSVMVNGLQQGLPLPVQPPKFANGVWLLEPEPHPVGNLTHEVSL
jgi:DICT domain-containing protein